MSSESSRASIARARLEEVVERGRAQAATILDRIERDAPQDAVVRATALAWSHDPEGRLTATAGEHAWGLHRNARGQVAERAGLPLAYLDALSVPDVVEVGSDGAVRVTADNGWRRTLAERNLAELYGHQASRYLVRSVRGEARGFMSDRYRRLDSRPLLQAFAEALQSVGAIPSDGTVSDTRVALTAIRPQVIEVHPGEHMVFGVEWHNSDFGNGTYSIRGFGLRLVCINGMVGQDALRQVHLGGRLGEDIEYSQRTYALDTRTMVSATSDVVRSALSEPAIERQVAAIRTAHERKVSWAEAARQVAAGLTKAEAAAAKDAFEGPDVLMLPPGQTAWRASNALSWLAGRAEDPERKLELQRLAGRIAMPEVKRAA